MILPGLYSEFDRSRCSVTLQLVTPERGGHEDFTPHFSVLQSFTRECSLFSLGLISPELDNYIEQGNAICNYSFDLFCHNIGLIDILPIESGGMNSASEVKTEEHIEIEKLSEHISSMLNRAISESAGLCESMTYRNIEILFDHATSLTDLSIPILDKALLLSRNSEYRGKIYNTLLCFHPYYAMTLCNELGYSPPAANQLLKSSYRLYVQSMV